MSVEPERVRNLELAQAEQMGRGEERWEGQKRLNEQLSGTISNHERRLVALEKRVMYFAGVSAALGALLGGVASRLLI
jgi:hypothetical protein